MCTADLGGGEGQLCTGRHLCTQSKQEGPHRTGIYFSGQRRIINYQAHWAGGLCQLVTTALSMVPATAMTLLACLLNRQTSEWSFPCTGLWQEQIVRSSKVPCVLLLSQGCEMNTLEAAIRLEGLSDAEWGPARERNGADLWGRVLNSGYISKYPGGFLFIF